MRIIFCNIFHSYFQKQLLNFIVKEKDKTDVFCFQEYCDSPNDVIKNVLVDYRQVKTSKLTKKENTYLQVAYIKKNIRLLDEKNVFKHENKYGLVGIYDLYDDQKIFCIGNVHGIWKPAGSKLDSCNRLEQSNRILQAVDLTKKQ